MSDKDNRLTVGGNDDSGRFRGLIDTLQDKIQNVETVARQSRFEISGGNVDQIDAPDDLDELVELAESVGFVWKAYQIFANEVWEPGFRLEGPDETVAFFMGETEDVDATPPEFAPEGGFLNNAAVYAGERHQDFFDFGKEATFQRRLRGTVLVELLKENDEEPESPITGFYFIRPETVSAEVYPNTNILIAPEDTEQDGVEITPRGEAAAYVQFDDESILGRRGKFAEEQEIPLSQNDVHKQVLNPGIGGGQTDEQGVFGTSGIEPIKEDIAEYRQFKRDMSQAISTKAYGLWDIEHGREVLDLGSEKQVIEWDDDSMENFEETLQDLDPGDFITHDGSVDLQRLTGEVPDLEDTLKHYVDDIFAGLPVSKFKIGFADDINRDVTSEQGEFDELQVSEEREYQERQWTQVLREVANRHDLDTEGLQLKIEPEPEDSPVMSMTTEEINKLAKYADALNSLAGPQGGPLTLVDRETLLTDVAQLPENSPEEMAQELEEVETDEDTETLFRAMTGMDTLAKHFEEGDPVDTPDGFGVVAEIRTSEFEGPSGETVEASEDNPAYVVALEDARIGSRAYRGDELTDTELPEGGPENPEEDLEEMQDTQGRDTLQETTFGIPDSWEESETPNRVILLKAWAGLGGRFTSCVREMRDDLAGSPDRFCGAMKDRVLQWEGWRQGG